MAREDISNKLMMFKSDRKNREIPFEKFNSEIYLLDACKLNWEDNLFDFYVDSIAFRIRILIKVTYSNQW